MAKIIKRRKATTKEELEQLEKHVRKLLQVLMEKFICGIL